MGVKKAELLGKGLPHAKYVPQRTCIACGKVEAKRELVRLVRIDDWVGVDFSGKNAGRGAYLCKTRECWEMVLRKDRLERALKVRISERNLEQLMAFYRNLPNITAPAPI